MIFIFLPSTVICFHSRWMHLWTPKWNGWEEWNPVQTRWKFSKNKTLCPWSMVHWPYHSPARLKRKFRSMWNRYNIILQPHVTSIGYIIWKLYELTVFINICWLLIATLSCGEDQLVVPECKHCPMNNETSSCTGDCYIEFQNRTCTQRGKNVFSLRKTKLD